MSRTPEHGFAIALRYAAEVRWLAELHASLIEAAAYHSNDDLTIAACLDATATGLVLAHTVRQHVRDQYDSKTHERYVEPHPAYYGLPSEALTYPVMISAIVSTQFMDRDLCARVEAAVQRILNEMVESLGPAEVATA